MQDSATTLSNIPQPKRTDRESVATAPAQSSGQRESAEFANDWFERLLRLSRTPETRKNLVPLLAQNINALLRAKDEQARVLGEIMASARAESMDTLLRVLNAAGPGRATWTRALCSGLIRMWPNALREIVLRDEKHKSQATLAALDACLADAHKDLRFAAARAVAVRARLGDPRAFRSLEMLALRADIPKDEKAVVVQLLWTEALAAIPNLAATRDVQEAVDVAVGVVDVSLKAGFEPLLDERLMELDPELLPAEVILAFLIASKPATDKLPRRKDLVSRFEAAIRGRRRDDADALMRFAR